MKKEFWDFFLNGEFIDKKNYTKPKLLDFSNEVPINYEGLNALK